MAELHFVLDATVGRPEVAMVQDGRDWKPEADTNSDAGVAVVTPPFFSGRPTACDKPNRNSIAVMT